MFLLPARTIPILSIPSCRQYATKPTGKSTAKRPVRAPSDPRNDIIKRALFPPSRIKRGPGPTGNHRPRVKTLLRAVIPSVEAHEIITKAWNIFQRDARQAREAALEKKYESMKRAMDELQIVHRGLYERAIEKPNIREFSEEERAANAGFKGADRRARESRIEGLFPREMRVPTDTPSRSGWDHDWKARL